MKPLLILLLAAFACAQVARIPGPGGQPAGPTTISITGATSVYSASSVTAVATSPALSQSSTDQICGRVYWTLSGSCAAASVALTDTALDTFTPEIAVLENQFTATQCGRIYCIRTANTNATNIISATITSASPPMGMDWHQAIHSANAGADAINCNNIGGGPSLNTVVIPAASGIPVAPCTTGTITTTANNSIVFAAISNSTAGGTYTSSPSSCFGGTGTLPTATNGSAAIGAMQYIAVPTSGTAGSCAFHMTNSSTYLGMIWAIH